MAECSGPAPREGYDNDFVGNIPKSLECPVCLLVLREPHVISCCGHHFCRPCIERVVQDKKPCPLCNEEDFTIFLHKGVLREVNALTVRCLQNQLGCEWEGELGYLQRHLATEGGDCLYVAVQCIYGCGKSFLRRHASEHETVCTKRPVEVQLNQAMKKLDAALGENRLLKDEVAQMKATNQAQLQRITTALQNLQDEGAALKIQIKQVEEQNTQLAKQVNEHNTAMLRLEKLFPVPPLIFYVPNASFHTKGTRWISHSFYSHIGGYKMAVHMSYDELVGRQHSIGMYIELMQGEYDDYLQWPFRGTVTIQAFNRSLKKWDLSETVIFQGGDAKRPLLFHDRLWGVSNFILCSALSHYGGEADILRIRINVTALISIT